MAKTIIYMNCLNMINTIHLMPNITVDKYKNHKTTNQNAPSFKSADKWVAGSGVGLIAASAIDTGIRCTNNSAIPYYDWLAFVIGLGLALSPVIAKIFSGK